MLTHAGRHLGRLAGQNLSPAKRTKKKRRLLEWFDSYEGIHRHGSTVSLDIKGQYAYCCTKDTPSVLSRIHYKKWYTEGFQKYEAVSEEVEPGDDVQLDLGNHYVVCSEIDTPNRMLYLATADQPSWIIKVSGA